MANKLYVKSDQPVGRAVVPFVNMTVNDLLRTMLVGAVVGVASTGIYYLLNNFIFSAALCRPGVQGCSNAPIYATVVTVVISAIIGIVALARAGVYRPLLVALAVPLALWGMFALMGGMAWYFGLLFGALLFALAYGLFAWVARLRSFIISIVLLVVLVVVTRLILG